jgi:thioredoxin-related protein
MKKFLLSLLAIAVFTAPAIAQKKPAAPKPPTPPAAPAGQQARTSLPLGSLIPNEGALLAGKDGQMISFMQAKTDKGLLVMFSCNTCPYVIKAQPRTRQAIDLAKKLGIGMVILNSNEAQRDGEDSPQAMMTYAIDQHYDVPYLRDDASMMADLFGATRTPEVFLFDGEGKLVYKGALEDNPAEPEKSKQLYLNLALRALGENRPITVAETKSIGCSIKRIH